MKTSELELILHLLAISAHLPWCDVAPGNRYSDGRKCDCGKEDAMRIISEEIEKNTTENTQHKNENNRT